MIACYEPLVRQKKIAGGALEAEIALGLGGEVVSARVRRATIHGEEAAACALAALRKARFPPPRAEDVGKPLVVGFGL
jgi:hypothetical protein